MQWISYFMIFSVLLIFILAYPPVERVGWRFFTTVLLLTLLLLAKIYWFQLDDKKLFRNDPRLTNWFVNIFTTLLVTAAFAITGRGEIVFLFFMQVAQFAVSLEVWPGGVVLGVISLAVSMGILKWYGASNDSLISFGAQFMTGMIFVLVFTVLVIQAEKEKGRAEGLLKELQAANLELKAAQQKEKELAIAEERMRMARDIHDGLGHHLTVLSIQLQAADKLVERNPSAAAEAIQTSRTEVKAALEEVRRSVSVMRETPEEIQPLVRMLTDLARDFDKHTGLKVDFECSGKPYELSSFARQTFYRAVQESLTNVQKHGQGVKQIQVRLDYSTENVSLAVTDDGEKPTEGFMGQTGFGLQGLRERVDQLGGTFCCGPGTSRGFQVNVTIPLEELQDDSTPAGR